MKKKAIAASPFSTGGGGTRFEWLVATSYVVRLLRGEGARGLPPASTVVEVRLQQATKNYPVDDVVVVGVRGTRESKLALQVKHSLRFAPNALFSDVMGACWRHFTASTFDRQRDLVGVAIGEGSNIPKIRAHLQELLQWARAHRTSHSFYVQVAKFKAKANLLRDISQALDTGASRHIGKERLWTLLRRFVVLSFDFDTTGSRDSTDCWNDLLSIVRRRSTKQATALFDGLYCLISRLSKAAGEIGCDTIRDELAENIPIGGGMPLRTVRATLVGQVSKQLLKEKKSKKYIPDVFTAIDSIKDAARYFSHPVHFAQKPLDEFHAIDSSFLDRLHAMLRISPIPLKLPRGFRAPKLLSQVSPKCAVLRPHLERLADQLDDYYKERWQGIREQVPEDIRYVFDDARYLLYGPGCSTQRSIKSIADDLLLMESRVFLLTSRAGQGKTNLVCDFAENVLLLHRIPCLFLTGRELRAVPVDELANHISTLVLGDDHGCTLDEALASVGSLCQETNTPFVVIFDGINEHPDIGRFATELEKVIERLLGAPCVKVIMTCRSEYFSQRFSNLLTASFSDSLHEVQEIHREMPERHSERMVRAYFRFFKIRQSFMSGTVRKALQGDPLLLRFFCEAYGDPDASESIALPAMADIYREVVFRRYLEKKLDEVASRQPAGPGSGISLARQYRSVLRDIVSAMVSNSQFADIPVSAVDTSRQPALAELIAEDVFVRKDLVAGKSVLDDDAEVINFTFDEFRDYLLADHLLNVVRANAGETAFRGALTEVTDDQCPVAEGVSRFIFYAAKKPEHAGLLAEIAAMPWYDTVFLQCIFSVEDAYVTDGDVRRVTREFSRSPGKAQQVFFALMQRWDTAALPRLNIDVLFAILNGLQDDSFRQLVRPIFYDPTSRYPSLSRAPYEIDRFASDIRSLVTRTASPWDTRYAKIVELLVYLFGIEGPGYDFPAYALFEELARERPDKAVEILSAHLDAELTTVRSQVWEMLAEFAARGVVMPDSLIGQASEILREAGATPSRATDEMRRFLVACRDKLGMRVPRDIDLTTPSPLIWLDILRKQ